MNEFTYDDVVTIAKYQKTLLWLILVSFCVFFAPALQLVVSIFAVIIIYKLASALKLSALLWTILAIFPLLGLLSISHVNSKATAALKAKNIRVGLMGANKKDLENALENLAKVFD